MGIVSRQPFGENRVMEIILALTGSCQNLKWPARRISQKIREMGECLSPLTVRKYLYVLKEAGLVELIYGGHRCAEIVRLEVLRRHLPKMEPPTPIAKRNSPTKEPKPIIQPLPVPHAKPTPNQSSGIVVLIDYDNAVSRAQENKFSLSFGKLKEYLRGFGTILFADALLSPTATGRAETIAQLWDSGFRVIACPMGHKDKDAVDAKLNWLARQYLDQPNIHALYIVSMDQDFRELADFAADMGKKVEFVDVAAINAQVAGFDQKIAISFSRQSENWTSALKFLEQGIEPVQVDTIQRVRFLRDIIRACEAKPAHQFMAFQVLHDFIWKMISQTWEKVYHSGELRSVMTAMNHNNVLQKNNGLKLTYYELNLNNPVVINALRRKIAVSS